MIVVGTFKSRIAKKLIHKTEIFLRLFTSATVRRALELQILQSYKNQLLRVLLRHTMVHVAQSATAKGNVTIRADFFGILIVASNRYKIEAIFLCGRIHIPTHSTFFTPNTMNMRCEQRNFKICSELQFSWHPRSVCVCTKFDTTTYQKIIDPSGSKSSGSNFECK